MDMEQTMSDIDEYMPTDAEWAAHPRAKFAATDSGGGMFLYEEMPELGRTVWWAVSTEFNLIRYIHSPADFRTTLRHRPPHL